MMQSNLFMFAFLLFLSFLRLWEKDVFGFFVFLGFSSMFIVAFLVDKSNKKKDKQKADRINFFNSIATPRINTKIDGYSSIVTLMVPSLDFFNEMKEKTK